MSLRGLVEGIPILFIFISKWTAETWPLFKYENNFQASFSCGYFTPEKKTKKIPNPTNHRTIEKYEKLWKPLKLSLLKFWIPGGHGARWCCQLWGFFYIVPGPEQQVELNANLGSNQTEWHLYFYSFYYFFCQPGGLQHFGIWVFAKQGCWTPVNEVSGCGWWFIKAIKRGKCFSSERNVLLVGCP